MHGTESLLLQQSINRFDCISDFDGILKARFLKITGETKELNQETVHRARQLSGLKGYVTNLDAKIMDGSAVIDAYHDLWKVEASFRMTKSDLRKPGRCSTTPRTPSKPT